MLRHLTILASILLLATLAAACEGGAPWAEEEETPTATARPDFGSIAAWDRRMIFLGAGDALPTAAILDFEALSDSAGVRRGLRARLVDGEEWISLMDAAWEMAPMRDPWRLVPQAPLRLIVSDAGELAALEVRGDVEVRLEPGRLLDEHAPDAGTQLMLREASLVLDGTSHAGVLLDAQLGRSVEPGFLPRTPDDSVAPAISPTARPGTEALLLDARGYYMVVASSANGELAWVHNAGRGEARVGIRLEPSELETFAEGAVDVPVAWRVLGPGGEVMGELRAEASDRAALAGPGDATALAYVLVSGWIEDRSARREVFGLVRTIR